MTDSGGPAGAPPLKDLEAAYRELLEGLWYAHKTFMERGDGGREGAALGCHAVVRFIAVRHENPEFAVPFLALHGALKDLEQGIRASLFGGEEEPKSRSRSRQKKHIKMWAAVLLEVLVKVGDPLPQAAQRVARKVGQWPGIGSQSITEKTIRNWRDHHRALPKAGRRQFELLREHLLNAPDRTQQIARLLDHGPPDTPSS
jgi:hypothetical protein